MDASRTTVWVFMLAAGLLACPGLAVNIETVPVGNPGNAPDSWLGVGYGAVSYEYNIGKYEVTAGQYAEFLNAVAATDTYGLYNTNMWSNQYGCKIQRSGADGSYSYNVASDYANRPVNYVSWGDSARFANWLHNGRPMGTQNASTTERGAYTLDGASTNAELLAITRNADWKWAITSQDEWYKAAYHKNDGVTGNYWLYPTSSDSAPSNQLLSPDPGNNANYLNNDGSYTIYQPYWRTEVGAFGNSSSPYGTFDQGGNTWEWNEAVISGAYRGLRGGSFNEAVNALLASNRIGYNPATEVSVIGFRVSEVPEPATVVMLALAGLGILRRKNA